VQQAGYGLLDGSIQWNSRNAKYSGSVGVKNALNKDYTLASSFTPGSGPVSVIPDRGREWYVSVKAEL